MSLVSFALNASIRFLKTLSNGHNSNHRHFSFLQIKLKNYLAVQKICNLFFYSHFDVFLFQLLSFPHKLAQQSRSLQVLAQCLPVFELTVQLVLPFSILRGRCVSQRQWFAVQMWTLQPPQQWHAVAILSLQCPVCQEALNELIFLWKTLGQARI